MFLTSVLAVVLSADGPAKVGYPPMPEAFSSFGAAIVDGRLYVYGGHVGKTHTYSTEAVTGKFRRLNLADPAGGWQELPAGPGLQGLALVAHRGKLYRIGGMQPRNPPGEPSDNHSLAECAVYDPGVGKWAPLPDMPAPRSSHDAVVAGDLLVVVGGWTLNGAGKKSTWQDTALLLDLSKTPLAWRPIPQPFARRALNAAAADGRVYVMGGLSSDNETEKSVDILDLATLRWSSGPQLPGPIRNGFTPAACAVADKVFASPADGKLYRLNDKKTAWDEVGALATKRLVHRLAPVNENVLLAIGGAGKGGNLADVERIEPACCVERPAAPARPGEQAVCPIMTSMPIGDEYREVEYRGVKIKLCCPTCVKKWNDDPEAYLNVAFLPQLKGMDLPKRKIEQVFCPVFRDRVVSPSGPAAEYRGATIYFANESARKRFLADPDQYADPAVLPQVRSSIKGRE